MGCFLDDSKIVGGPLGPWCICPGDPLPLDSYVYIYIIVYIYYDIYITIYIYILLCIQIYNWRYSIHMYIIGGVSPIYYVTN
jgi:hypothetical protein